MHHKFTWHYRNYRKSSDTADRQLLFSILGFFSCSCWCCWWYCCHRCWRRRHRRMVVDNSWYALVPSVYIQHRDSIEIDVWKFCPKLYNAIQHTVLHCTILQIYVFYVRHMPCALCSGVYFIIFYSTLASPAPARRRNDCMYSTTHCRRRRRRRPVVVSVLLCKLCVCNEKRDLGSLNDY